MTDGLQLRGNPGRRRRLSDVETERLMLEAGRAVVAQEGLSLSLEHVSMEDLIQTAGVSRTSSYRRWPTKDAFAADLLLYIAEHTELSSDFAPYAEAVRTIPAGVLTSLDTEQGRRDAIVEVFRVLTDADYAAALGSQTWRSYQVLRAAHGALPDGELRRRIASALRGTERRFVHYRAAMFAAAAELMGYRLRNPEAFDWRTLAEITSATFTGMAVRGYSDPEAVRTPRSCAPFGSSRTAPWTLPALAAAEVFFAATEPDPEAVWDAARVARAAAQLGDIDATLADLWAGGQSASTLG
ncbi:hypothetical protein [Raineyella sp. W15-4]|uniref:TetR/AcrR family transcriptional regulator n=1 Tax=Raineyella sp. W15-4 TaxID=3081651 RepID=UPI002953B166|nr:hypothetical protein [Raineyella sp. W15-4]WOQ17266.1 hypothetical protein R0145_00710 [Raineyella sp. W15-4]